MEMEMAMAVEMGTGMGVESEGRIVPGTPKGARKPGVVSISLDWSHGFGVVTAA